MRKVRLTFDLNSIFGGKFDSLAAKTALPIVSTMDMDLEERTCEREKTVKANATDCSRLMKYKPRKLFPREKLLGAVVRKQCKRTRTRVKNGIEKENMQQMCLDFGQKKLGHVTCKVCGMVYTFGHTEDEMDHSKFHRKYLTGVTFRGWKNERVVTTHMDGRIVMVLPDDSKHHLKKVEELCIVVDAELGYAIGVSPWKPTSKVILYVI